MPFWKTENEDMEGFQDSQAQKAGCTETFSGITKSYSVGPVRVQSGSLVCWGEWGRLDCSVKHPEDILVISAYTGCLKPTPCQTNGLCMASSSKVKLGLTEPAGNPCVVIKRGNPYSSSGARCGCAIVLLCVYKRAICRTSVIRQQGSWLKCRSTGLTGPGLATRHFLRQSFSSYQLSQAYW